MKLLECNHCILLLDFNVGTTQFEYVQYASKHSLPRFRLQKAMAAVSFLMKKLGDDVNGLRWVVPLLMQEKVYQKRNLDKIKFLQTQTLQSCS
jgi:hypothetical protein